METLKINVQFSLDFTYQKENKRTRTQVSMLVSGLRSATLPFTMENMSRVAIYKPIIE